MKTKVAFRILLLALFAFLTGCGEWDGGEFAGQPVYDLTNERLSKAAIDMLKGCGLADDGIHKKENSGQDTIIIKGSGKSRIAIYYDTDLYAEKNVNFDTGEIDD